MAAIAAGTSFATAATAPAVAELAADEAAELTELTADEAAELTEDELLLLLPHPAIAAARVTRSLRKACSSVYA